MEKNTGTDENSEETGAESQGSGKSTGFENVKNIIADQLHNVAQTLGEKAADRGAQSVTAQYKNLASEWLDQSAEYIRQFECEQADARVREYVGQRPGRSLLIAGGVGLIIGAFIRRK